MKKITAIGVVAATALTGAILAACGTSSPGTSPAPSTTTAAPSESPAPSESHTPSESPAPTGEIWQWALGRNLWNDPALESYARHLGVSWGQSTDAVVQSQGFALTADSAGIVTSVTVYNDWADLGLPQSSGSYNAYQGKLPAGLTWSDTGSDVGAVYGTQSIGGYGSGLPLTFDYTTSDGYHLTITFNAKTAAELPSAPMLSILVRS